MGARVCARASERERADGCDVAQYVLLHLTAEPLCWTYVGVKGERRVERRAEMRARVLVKVSA